MANAQTGCFFSQASWQWMHRPASGVAFRRAAGMCTPQSVHSPYVPASMRAKALDELERDADKANANLSGPTIGFVVTTIVFLAYPLAQRISDAFGG